MTNRADTMSCLDRWPGAGAAAGSNLASGTSPVTLSLDLAAGSYGFVVSGDQTSFELEVMHPAP